MAKSKARKRKKKGGGDVSRIPLIEAQLNDYGASIRIDGEAFGLEKMSDVLSEFVRPAAVLLLIGHRSSRLVR
jgi:predicted RNA-binding protein with RPS1 domain